MLWRAFVGLLLAAAFLPAQTFTLSSPSSLLKLDPQTNSVAASTALPPGTSGVAVLPSSSAVLIASYRVIDNDYDLVLTALDPRDLSLIYTRPFPRPGNQFPSALAVRADGTISLAAFTDTPDPQGDILLLRIQPATGEVISTVTLGGKGRDIPVAVDTTPEDYLRITGWSAFPDRPAFLLTLDPSDHLLSTTYLPKPGFPSTPEAPQPNKANFAQPQSAQTDTAELRNKANSGFNPITACVPSVDPTPADCDSILIEDTITPGALGSRTPIILIHDIHGNRQGSTDSANNPNRAYWNSLLTDFAATPQFISKYKVFRFHYVSDRYSSWDLARALRNQLDNLIFNYPEYDTRFTLLGHGLGGIIARSYMDHHWHWSGSGTSVYRARRAGERIINAFTLATPHNGTPLFNQTNPFAWTPALDAATAVFWNAYGCTTCANRTDFSTGFPAISSTFDSKVIAYWGYLDSSSSITSLARTSPADLATQIADGNIAASAVVLERVTSNSWATSTPVLAARNDGWIPASSAAFEGHAISKRVGCANYDHTLMLYGSTSNCSSGLPLLSSILSDLGAPNNGTNPITPSAGGQLPTPRVGCTYTFSTTTVNHPYTSATGSITITPSATCTWQALSLAPWLTITGTSATSLAYSAETNPNSAPRTGIILVTGPQSPTPIYITQDSSTGACFWSLNPDYAAFSNAQFATSTTVLAPSTCSWTPSADAAWLTVSPTTAQTGSKALSITGTANTATQARFGAVNVTPSLGPTNVFQVEQAGTTSPCAFSLSPPTTSLTSSAGSGIFSIQTQSNCAWTATTADSWVSITSAASGTGSANVTFSATSNSATARRFAAITIRGGSSFIAHSIVQDGSGFSTPTMSVSGSPFDFGTSLVDIPTYRAIPVQNTGFSTLYISGVSQISGQPGFRIETPLYAVPPSSTGYFTMAFTPGSQIASTATFRITSNDPNNPTLDFTVTGTGVSTASNGNLIVGPSSASFGNVVVGAIAEIPIAIQNRDATTIAINYNWTQSGDFRLLNAPATLAPNTGATIRVRLVPTTTGSKTNTLTITSSGAGAPSYNVTLSGTGTAAGASNFQVTRSMLLSGAGSPVRMTIANNRAFVSRANPPGLSVVDLNSGASLGYASFSTYSNAFPGQPAANFTRAWVPLSNLGSNGQIAVVDLSSYSVTQYFGAGTDPHGAAISDNQLYISNNNCPTTGLSLVRVFDTSSNAALTSYQAGRMANWVATDQTTRRAVVSNYGCGTPDPGAGLLVIDLNNQTLLGTYAIRQSPNAVAISGSKAYINTGQTVEVVDLSSLQTVASVPVPDPSTGIAATPNYVYVANSLANSITIISTATQSVAGTVNLSGIQAIAADPSADALYVATASSIQVIQPRQPSFDLSCSPSAFVNPSASCTLAANDGFASTVSLSCVGIAPGLGCSFSPPSVIPPATSTLTLTASALSPGNYPVTVSAIGASTLRTAALNLTVPTCAYQLAPTSQQISGAGGNGSTSVQTSTGCAWTASSNVAWITVTAGQSGTGAGPVSFTVAANQGSSRSGTITIAGQTFTVDQGAVSCSYTLQPSSASFDASTQNGSITLTASGTGCAWTAASNSPFITLTSAPSGTGSTTVTYSISANSSATARSGSLSIAGQTFAVDQAGVSCTYNLSPPSVSIDANANTGTVTLTAPNPACSWTASSNANWITITSGASGSGNGSLGYSVTANTTLSQRSGSITIGGATFTVNQAAASCTFSLNAASASFDGTGGSASVGLTASNAGCSWTAASNQSWLTITANASGTGNASVSYSVAANAGLTARSATLTIAGQTFTVNQTGAACTFSLTPTTASFDPNANSGNISITASNAGCSWTSSSGQAWVTITAGASGTGNGSTAYSVAANPNPAPRSAILTVAGQNFTVNQAAATCAFTLTPVSASPAAAGGPTSVTVNASAAGCPWTATSNTPWLTITSGASGTGSGTVSYNIASNPDISPRSGSLTVAGSNFPVTQSGVACTYTLTSSSASFDANAGLSSVGVTASNAACAWTASSNTAWLSVTAGASGTGSGTVSYSVAANTTLSPRSGILTIAGQTFTVNQAAPPCTFSLSSTNASVGADGGALSVTVNASNSACSRSAVSNVPWISVTSGASGLGTGPVTFSVAPNTTISPRSGTLTIAGNTFTVDQAAQVCSLSVSPFSQAVAAESGTGSVTISANNSGCSWVAVSIDSWVTITSAGSGNGPATVTYSFSANPAATARSGRLSVAGQIVSISQAAAPCTYALGPAAGISVSPSATAATVNVGTSYPQCAWTASSNANWITVTSGASGAGAGSVAISIAANTGASPRTGTLTIAGQTYPVSQAGLSCSFNLNVASGHLSYSLGIGQVSVTASNSSCAWTATANAPWATVTSGASSTGSGTVNYSVSANTSPTSRSTTLSIAGLSFAIDQDAAPCAFTLNSPSAFFTPAGGPASVGFTANNSSCAWSASSNASWVSITSAASGTGSGALSIQVSPYTDILARNATITVAGQNFDISQAGATCTYSLLPSSETFSASAASAAVAVTGGPSCTWQASSNTPWVTVTSGASAVGPGTVGYSVAQNDTLSSRTGSMTIAGRTFNVTQAAAQCSYSLSPSSGSYGAAGGNFSISVTATPPVCQWSASSSADWISITSGVNGAGNGGVSIAVTPNASPSARSGVLTIAGITFNASQTGAACSFLVSPTSSSLGFSGGPGTITISASNPTCPWNASVNDSWLSLTSGASGVGSGSVSFSAAANAAATSRSGTLTVAGQTVSISQTGLVCSFSLAAPSADFGAGAGSSVISLTASNPSCSWTASANNAWLTVTGPSAGAGSSSISFSATNNPVTTPRTGTFTVAGLTFTVNQGGIYQPGRTPTAAFLNATGGVGIATYASTSFNIFPALFTGDPASAQDAAGNTFIVARDSTGSYWTVVYSATANTWGSWVNGRGLFKGSPAVAVTPSGTAYIVGRDNYNSYWLATYSPAQGFSRWEFLAGLFSSDPAIAAAPDGSLYIIGKDLFSTMWSNHYIPGSGSQGWVWGGGIAKGRPSVVVGTDNIAHMVIRDLWDSMWIARIKNNTWLNWTYGAGITGVDPAIVANGTGTLYVQILAPGGVMYYNPFTEGVPNGWQGWTGTGVLSAASAAGSSGDLYVFGRDVLGQHWWFRASAGQWINVGNNGVSASQISGATRGP